MNNVTAVLAIVASSVVGLNVAAAQSIPTVAAGIVEVIDSTSPTFSNVPIWNPGGLYVHQASTTTTNEITAPGGTNPITNLRGIKSFNDSTSPSGVATWMWTSHAVYLRVFGTTTTTEITDPLGQSIVNVKGIVGNADASSPTGNSVWIWTPSAVYLHKVGTTGTTEITLQGGSSIAGVRGMLATNPPASPGTGHIWMWTPGGVYRHAVSTTIVTTITSPTGQAIPNLRGMLISSDTGTVPAGNPVWLYNGSNLYLNTGGNSTTEITHPSGSTFNDIKGMIYTEDINSPSGFPVWIWTSYGVFRHQYGSTTTVELTTPLGGALANVRGIVAGQQAASISVPLVFNGAGVYSLVYGTSPMATVEYTHPSGGPITNTRGVLSFFDSTSPIGYRRVIWNDAGAYLHLVGSTTTQAITTPTGATMSGLRGMLASLDTSSPSNTSLWMWTGAGVYKHVFGSLTTVEITDSSPSQLPLTNTWSIHSSFNNLTAGASHWIRNSTGVYLHTFGTTQAVPITRPNGTPITSPAYNAPLSSVAIVRNDEYTFGGGGAGAGTSRTDLPYSVDAWGDAVNQAHASPGVPTPVDLTTVVAGSGSQAAYDAGAFVWNAHESVLITMLEEPATGACCDGAICQQTTAQLCSITGGQYQGDGTTCGPATCLSGQCTGLCPQDIAWELLATVGPGPRSGHAMTYDKDRQRTVLFGGGSPDDETWELDSNGWIQRNSAQSPPGRFRHEMVYDSANGVTIMFGGWNSSSQFFNDTWVWDGNDWTEQLPVVSPPARIVFGMAYDARRQVVVMFGGADSSLTKRNETWEYSFSLNTWNQRFPTTSPSARTAFGMAYDSVRGVTVLQGGVTNSGGSAETWEYDGANWTLVSTPTNPGPRNEHKMAYDETRHVCVVYGGNNAAYDDVWEYDGDQWRSDADNAPGIRPAPAMVYDDARKQIVLFGGSVDSSTWGYPGSSTSQHYIIAGQPDGIGWSWNVAGPSVDVCDLTVPGIPSGSPLIELSWEFADSIDAAGCHGLQATATELTPSTSLLSITVGGNQPFDVCVGPFGQTASCCVGTSGTCSFNPEIQPILLSGEDCNANGMDDTIDLCLGTSNDQNGNGEPDECESTGGLLPPLVLAEGSRYIGIASSGQMGEFALRLSGALADDQVVCVDGYVAPDGMLVDAPVYMPLIDMAIIHLHGLAIIPGATYEVTLENAEGDTSPSVTVTTNNYGDVDGNGIANFEDILLVVLAFQGQFSYAADVEPCVPNGVINFADILRDVQAFQGFEFEAMNCDEACSL